MLVTVSSSPPKEIDYTPQEFPNGLGITTEAADYGVARVGQIVLKIVDRLYYPEDATSGFHSGNPLDCSTLRIRKLRRGESVTFTGE